jgi:glycosyltransferase involved in cell wall biosynthesis
LAVVGHIGHAKGSGVVLDLAHLAKRLGAALEIVVIGTIEGPTDGLPIHATGHYKHADLAELIKRHNIHMALMSSVYPETFSYVTHELMQLEVPIICFDLGAQAEVVRPYAKGCVIRSGSTEQLFLRIQEFKRSLDKQSLPLTCS